MRRLGVPLLLLAGAAAAGAVWRFGPLEPGDPFTGTLAILPLVVAALTALGHHAEGRGARRLPPTLAAAVAAGLGAVVLLVLRRPTLGLSAADEVLAAALALVLAAYLGGRLLTLRPLLGRRLPERPPAVFFLLPFVVYLALLPWSAHHRQPDGDEPWYLLITHSLAYDFDADLANDYAAGSWRHFIDRPLEPQPGDPRGPEGQVYSRHNALLPLILAPAYRLAGKNGALAVMALLAAALAWMILRLGRHYAPDRPGEVLAVYALVAFAPPLLLYSYQVWVEVPAALLSMIALDGILLLKRGRGDRAPAGPGPPSAAQRRRAWLTIAAALLLLPFLKIRFMLLAVPLLALAWWYNGRPWRPAVALGLMLTAAGGGILLHNQLRYGNPLKIHSWQELVPQRYSAVDFAGGFLGLFYDVAFGLFACAPLWMLLLPAAILILSRRHTLPVDLGIYALPYLLVVVPRSEWYGGWSPPFRYALVALPLLGLALVPLLARRRQAGARALLAALGALTLVLTLLWVVVPGWTYNLADGRSYLLDHLSTRLGADVARLFPSAVRPRAATWLWPPLSLAVVSLAWWWPRRRPRRPALWGVAGLLVALAAVPMAARTLPTRVIELEDPQVVKQGGHPQPERWVIDRTRFRGSWVLRQGDGLRAPVVAGGSRVGLTLQAFFVRHSKGPVHLEVWASGKLLGEIRLDEARQWRTYTLDEVEWPPGAEDLILVMPARKSPGRPNGVVLDRVDLAWR